MVWTDEPTTVPAMLDHMAWQHGGHAAVVENGHSTSYAELVTEVRTAASALVASGLTPGDRIAVWMPNRREFMVAMLAAQLIGAAVTPVNTRYRGHEAHDLLRRSRSKFLFVDNGFLDNDYIGMLASAAADHSPSSEAGFAGLRDLREIINVGVTDSTPESVSWSSFMKRADDNADISVRSFVAAVGPDDVCDILFTSGTTGVPKGVMSSQRQTIDIGRIWASGADLTTGDKYAIVNPFFHTFGYKAGFIAAFVAGSTVYPVATFDPTALFQLIEEEKISVLPGSPTIFSSLMNHPDVDRFDTSSLRFSIAGAASVPESLFYDMQNILGFEQVGQAYGLTECVVATQSRPNEDPFHVAETTGPAVPGTEIRIADPSGNAIPDGDDGEILIRGANVMLGYLDDEHATAEAIDPDGWLHTGDVGRLDEHGCVKITGRLKEMFTVGGFNVYPAEIENVLSEHPAVREAAVVGIPDDRLGSVGRAYVAIRESAAEPTIDEMISFCRERLANFKVPREVAFISTFPRNAMGKILKTELSTTEA